MSARIDIKRTVKEFDGEKLDVNPAWVTRQPDGTQVFQHPTNETNTYNGEEVEDATVDRTWIVKVGDEVLDPDWSWDTVKLSEAEDLETLYGKPFSDFRSDFPGSAKAVRLFILMLMKRKNPSARLKDADVPVNDFTIDTADVDVVATPLTEDPSSAAAGETPSGSENDAETTPLPPPTSSESSETTGSD